MASSRSFSLQLSMDNVRVSREGQQSVELGVAQLTPSSIARVFSVSPYECESRWHSSISGADGYMILID